MYTQQGYRPPQMSESYQAQRPQEPSRARTPRVAKAATPRPKAAQTTAPRPRAQKPAAKREPQRAPKKRGFKGFLIRALIVLVLLAAGASALYVFKLQSDVRPYTTTFLDNVRVDGIDLTGMTWEQGASAVWAQANQKESGWYVRLRNRNGEYKDITAQTLGISFDPSAALEQAWAVGHTLEGVDKNALFGVPALQETLRVIQRQRDASQDFYSVRQDGDTTAIDLILDKLERAAYIAPQDAAITAFEPDDTVNPFRFQSEVVGQRLDTTALREQIMSMVQTFQSGEVLVEPTPIQPSVTVAQLQKTVSLRARAVTPIDRSSTNERNNNIRVAFSKINGLVLNDDTKFSFNKTVGKRTTDNGFFEAFEYSYGELEIGVGGGVCQASTTVYLAAILGGMTITDHTSHSTPVSYTAMGKDATVSDTRGREIDFVFRNKSGGKIFISAHVIADSANKKRLLCEVRIYGLALDNTRYELETETVKTIAAPLEPEYIKDKNAKYVTYVDEQKTVIKPSDGYVVDTYLCTIVGDAVTERKKVATSTYKARAERIYVGITER